MATRNPQSSQAEFPNFNKFPLELKFKVFGFALPDSRIIEVFYDSKRKRFTTDAKVPALLHVCQASRVEALKVFSLFEMKVDSRENDISRFLDHRDLPAPRVPYMLHHFEEGDVNAVKLPFKTYIQWDVDVFSLSPNHFQSRGQDRYPFHYKDFLKGMGKNTEIRTRLRYLAMEAKTFKPLVMAEPISKMHALEFLLLIVGDTCCSKTVKSQWYTETVDASEHKKIGTFEDVEEPENAIMNIHDKKKFDTLGRESVADGADMKLAFFLVEDTEKLLLKELGNKTRSLNARERGTRMDWKDFEVEAVMVARGFGGY